MFWYDCGEVVVWWFDFVVFVDLFVVMCWLFCCVVCVCIFGDWLM